MDAKVTHGDAYHVACPTCGENIELWESVGELGEGDEVMCGHCGKYAIVHQLQHVVEISLTA